MDNIRKGLQQIVRGGESVGRQAANVAMKIKVKATLATSHPTEDFMDDFVVLKTKLKESKRTLGRLNTEQQKCWQAAGQFLRHYDAFVTGMAEFASIDPDAMDPALVSFMSLHAGIRERIEGMLRALEESSRSSIEALQAHLDHAQEEKDACYKVWGEQQASISTPEPRRAGDTGSWKQTSTTTVDKGARFEEAQLRAIASMLMSEESRPLVCYQLIDKARLEVYDAVTACVSLYAQDDINDILGAQMASAIEQLEDRAARRKEGDRRDDVPRAPRQLVCLAPSADEATADSPSVEAVETSESGTVLITTPLWTPQIHINEPILFRVFDCAHVFGDTRVQGSLIGTQYRIMFMPTGNLRRRRQMSRPAGAWSVPCMAVSRADCVQTSAGCVITLECITGRDYSIEIPAANSVNPVTIFKHISTGALSTADASFAFSYVLPMAGPEVTYCDGWTIYDPVEEYARLGIFEDAPAVGSMGFRLSRMNSSYDILSYPSLLAVPADLSDDELKSASTGRMKKRFPVVSWYDPRRNLAIVRASQPRVGMSLKRHEGDTSLVRQLGSRVTVLDARPRLNAIANMSMGGGFETPDLYKNCDTVEFLGIDNIHSVRSAFARMMGGVGVGVPGGSIAGTPTGTDLAEVEAREWLRLVAAIVAGAGRVLHALAVARTSVLVHCSDGWDRTAQVTSLAQLVLDPYYRTTRGFCVLVEKEWLAFGHQFARRYGRGGSRADARDTQRSPVFPQWLDAVWQTVRANPNAFEFTEALLEFLLYHLYSCRFGTFLFDSEMERKRRGVDQTTNSIWTAVLLDHVRFGNVGYDPEAKPVLPAEGGVAVWGAYWRMDRFDMEEPFAY